MVIVCCHLQIEAAYLPPLHFFCYFLYTTTSLVPKQVTNVTSNPIYFLHSTLTMSLSDSYAPITYPDFVYHAQHW